MSLRQRNRTPESIEGDSVGRQGGSVANDTFFRARVGAGPSATPLDGGSCPVQRPFMAPRRDLGALAHSIDPRRYGVCSAQFREVYPPLGKGAEAGPRDALGIAALLGTAYPAVAS